MAIQFARIEIVSRSSGGNACCKGAYNARGKIKDEKTNVTYNFQARGDNVHHEILLPAGADSSFKDAATLMNAVELAERRKDSQLLKDVVIALPDDKELSLEDRIEITRRLIAKRGWVQDGLAVQFDIHQPHKDEKNWHAHLLVLTRRFTPDGKSLGAKARDLNPEFKNSGTKSFIVPEEQQIHEELKDIINDYFKELGLANRVDEISTVPQEHIGPVRMRSILNEAAERNEQRALAHLENMRDGDSVLDRITKTQSVFSARDLERAVKDVPSLDMQKKLVLEALSSDRLMKLYDYDGKEAGKEEIDIGCYTTHEVREEEERIMRVAARIHGQNNYMRTPKVALQIKKAANVLSERQQEAVSAILLGEGGVRVLRGRAGTGKSHVLGVSNQIAEKCGYSVIGLAPTNKAKNELQEKGFNETFTVKGFLFGLHNGRI